MTQCSFAKPVNNGLVDLLISIDNAELHYSHVDLQGKSGGPIASLGPLGWSIIGTPDETKLRESDLISFVPYLQKNLYGATEENLVVMSITALRESGISRSLAQNILTDSYSPRKND